ncbi:hypothetical protein KAH37_06935 [bacterium]|nr:hypothetical protein [bacterium]
MNRRDLVVILSAYTIKVVLVSDELRSQYAVSEHFEPSGLFEQEYAVFTGIVEDIEEQVGISLLDEEGNIIVGSKDMVGVNDVHFVLLPEYFLNGFVVALSKLSLHKIERLISSLPITPLYKSHLMELKPEEMVSSFNLLKPELTILTGGEIASPVRGLVTLADYFSLVESDKTDNSLLFIGSGAEKNEIFKRLIPTFSLSHFSPHFDRDSTLFTDISDTVNALLLNRLKSQLPEFSPLFSFGNAALISETIREEATQISQFYEDNVLVIYYAFSFVVYAVSWKEDGQWQSDLKMVEYRDLPQIESYPALQLLLGSEFYNPVLLQDYASDIVTLATQNIDAILSAGLSEEALFDTTNSYLFSKERSAKEQKYLCNRLVYGGELVETIKERDDIFRNFSSIKLLASFAHIYFDDDQRFLVFSAMAQNSSEQAKIVVEQNTAPPLSFQGYSLIPDCTSNLSKISIKLLISGGDIDGTTTKELTSGYRHFFQLTPGQRALIELSGGTIAGKKEHTFVCEEQEFSLFIDLRSV